MANNLTRFEPFNDLARFDPFRNFDSMFSDFRMPTALRSLDLDSRIRMDVQEAEQSFLVRAELPGVNKSDIKVAINGDEVTISAESHRDHDEKFGTMMCSERYAGQYYRRFSLPQDVDDSKAKAKFQDGILELTLPKRPGTGGKQVHIQ
jgi:HSP20 family protein